MTHDGPTPEAPLSPELRQDLLLRLRRAEGQVRGVQRMVDEDRSCGEILAQVASVHEALRSVGKLLIHKHMQERIGEAVRSGDAGEAQRAYAEVLELMYRHAR